MKWSVVSVLGLVCAVGLTAAANQGLAASVPGTPVRAEEAEQVKGGVCDKYSQVKCWQQFNGRQCANPLVIILDLKTGTLGERSGSIDCAGNVSCTNQFPTFKAGCSKSGPGAIETP